MSIQVELRVGMIDMSLAQLLTNDHRIIEFPSILLPDDVTSGSIIRLSCSRAKEAEEEDTRIFKQVQHDILEEFTREPKTPVLRVYNYTQTSVVLEWDLVDAGSAELQSLALYKNGQQLGVIPNPDKRISTKLSNLEIDKEYQFELVLTTSAGVYKSNLIDVRTHKMTDLSGLTVCVGNLEGSEFSRLDIEDTIKRIGARPIQDEVQLDTTHFICTEADDVQSQRAQVRNVPIVRPEWLKACEFERRLVEVRQYYLTEDPRLVAPHRPRVGSVATAATEGDVSVADTDDRRDQDSIRSIKSDKSRASKVSDNNVGEESKDTENVLPPDENAVPTESTAAAEPPASVDPTGASPAPPATAETIEPAQITPGNDFTTDSSDSSQNGQGDGELESVSGTVNAEEGTAAQTGYDAKEGTTKPVEQAASSHESDLVARESVEPNLSAEDANGSAENADIDQQPDASSDQNPIQEEAEQDISEIGGTNMQSTEEVAEQTSIDKESYQVSSAPPTEESTTTTSCEPAAQPQDEQDLSSEPTSETPSRPATEEIAEQTPEQSPEPATTQTSSSASASKPKKKKGKKNKK